MAENLEEGVSGARKLLFLQSSGLKVDGFQMAKAWQRLTLDAVKSLAAKIWRFSLRF